MSVTYRNENNGQQVVCDEKDEWFEARDNWHVWSEPQPVIEYPVVEEGVTVLGPECILNPETGNITYKGVFYIREEPVKYEDEPAIAAVAAEVAKDAATTKTVKGK